MTKGRKILLMLLALVGLAVLSYPTVSDYLNRLHSSWAIAQARQTEQTTPEELARAQQYNAQLLAGKTPTGYEEILDVSDGIMGAIRIPDIQVNLPIYHGVEETVLEKGAGHLPQSAFPIGGVGNHTVITGHTGLPSAQLFTDLIELEVGDLFYISIQGDTLAYSVDQILVVLPQETEALQPVPGQDYCTLVTCTPYGINSHRLLVRGVRTELTQQAQMLLPEEETAVAMPAQLIAVIAAGALLLTGMMITALKKKKE